MTKKTLSQGSRQALLRTVEQIHLRETIRAGDNDSGSTPGDGSGANISLHCSYLVTTC